MSIPVFATGKSLTSSGTSVYSQIPADSAGCLPLFVRVTATAAGYFRISSDGQSAVIGDVLVQPSDGLILKTCGLSWFSFVSHSGSSTVTVTPIDVGGVAYPNGFNPLSFFLASEQGAWYDPSDLTTLFQDSAGTIPVTAVEQPVGLMLDKSGRNNHAFQTTSANRPVLSARVNLLTYSEQFDNAIWIGTNASSVANTVIAPDGTLTADKIVDAAIAGVHVVAQAATIVAGSTYTLSVYLRAAERTKARLSASSLGALVNVDLSAGTVSGGSGTGYVSSSITSVGNGWYRVSLTFAETTSGYRGHAIYLEDATGATSYTGDGYSGIYIWGADLRVTNTGVNLPAYQRVNTSTDYDTAGFPLYLKANGTNSAMQTNSINFTGTDKMTVWVGVRKLSDAGTGSLLELSTGADANNGAFFIRAPSGGLSNYQFYTRGTQGPSVEPTSYVAPITNVLAAIGEISTPIATLRTNGTQAATRSSSQGTGTYGNYPLYLFARAGTSLFFNGNFYGAIIRGAASSAAEIAAAESYMNSKTKAY